MFSVLVKGWKIQAKAGLGKEPNRFLTKVKLDFASALGRGLRVIFAQTLEQ